MVVSERWPDSLRDDLPQIAFPEPQSATHELHHGDAPLMGPLVEGRRLHGEESCGVADVEQAVGERVLPAVR